MLVFYGSSTLLSLFRARSVNLSTLLPGKPPRQFTSTVSAHSFASNWQLPFLNQRKGENGRRNFFITNHLLRMFAGREDRIRDWPIPDGRASDRATTHGKILKRFDWLCWGLTSQSTIFQSCRDGATASWVINQYFRGVTCLAQGHNTAAVGFEPPTSRSGVRHSTTEPPRSPQIKKKRVVSWSRAVIPPKVNVIGSILAGGDIQVLHINGA